MIRKFISLFLLSAITPIFAQTSFDMENWISQPGPPPYDEPSGWTTANILSNFLLGGSPVSVKKSTPGNGGSGTAARIETVKLKSNPSGGQIPDTAGVMFTGSLTMGATLKINYGFPFSSKAGSLKFFSKYTPNGTDTAIVKVMMTSNTSGKRDTIGVGYAYIVGTSASFSENEAIIKYDTNYKGIQPDTCTIYVSSSGLNKPKIGSVLFVDDFTFTAPINIGMAALENAPKITMYQNPEYGTITLVNENAEIFSLSIFDLTGKSYQKTELIFGKNNITTSLFHSGIYIFQVSDKNGAIVKSGKFTIGK